MDKFNYCVGRKYGQGFSSFSVNNRKWGRANTSTIPFATQLNEIQYGTMEDAEKFKPVSYTHLTLPTKRIV